MSRHPERKERLKYISSIVIDLKAEFREAPSKFRNYFLSSSNKHVKKIFSSIPKDE